ncbi:MAG TPA: hypothetical protein VGM37_04390 [Armatimonadota bacterium]
MKRATILIAVLALSGAARAVPNTVNFQGAVKVNGLPYSGQGYFKFALIDPAKSSKLWDNAGATTGAEPTAAVPLTVTAGLATAQLGLTTQGFAALPATTFRTNAALRVWFSTSSGGPFQLLSPDQVLASAPYASVAALALSADAASNASALGGFAASQFQRAAFVTGATSGLTSAYNLKVQIGTATPSSAIAFGGKATITLPLDAVSKVPIGSAGYSSFSLRQKLTTDTTWFTKTKSLGVFGDVTLYLYNGSAEVCRWKFAQCQPTAWRSELADDGLPVERIDLQPTSLTRTRAASATAVGRPTASPQSNVVSGYTGATYKVAIDGTSYADYVVASNAGITLSSDFSSYEASDFTLRQNPTASTKLYSWFNAWVTGVSNTSKVTLSVVTGSTTNASFSAIAAVPYVYSLYLADDGLPVEDFRMAAFDAARP